MPSLNVKDYLLAGACGLALLSLCLLGLQTWRADRLKDRVEAAEARELGAKIRRALQAFLSASRPCGVAA